MPTQKDLYYAAERKSASLDKLMLEMLYGAHPITDAELGALIAKRPHVYGRYAGYIGKRKQESQNV